MKKIFRILIFVLVFTQGYAHSNTLAALKEISLKTPVTKNGYTFHFYSSDGKLNRGFSEIYIALTDSNNNFVKNFTVGNFFPKDTALHSTPVGKVEKVDSVLYKTWFSFLQSGTWSLSFKDTIGSTTAASADTTTTETQIGFFKDRNCVGAIKQPLTRSCGIACATGAGSMAGCWKSGLGVFIYNPTDTTSITKTVAQSDAHYLLFDAQSKELTRAFIESLPSAASGKISIKVTGYRVKNGISANSTETYVPELSADSTVHYLNAFHLLSIEGTHISGLTYSYSKFDTISYKLTPADLAPTNLSAVNYTGGATVKFTPPANAASAKTTLKGYKVRVYNAAGVLQDSYTTTVNDSSVTSINVAGFTANQHYTYSVSALYPGSGVVVESTHSSVVADSISDVTLTVPDSTYYTKWVQGFKYNDTTYYLSVAYPKSIIVGSQTVKAYINKQVTASQPYPVVNGGFKITPAPFMESMGHASDGNTSLTWDSTANVYTGTLKFSMEGDWLVNLKIYKTGTDSLIAGTDLDSNGDGSTLNWLFYLENSAGIQEITNKESNSVFIYPNLSQGKITVISPAESRIKIIDTTGKTIGSYQSSGRRTIELNVSPGLYFVLVQSSGITSVQKVIITK